VIAPDDLPTAEYSPLKPADRGNRMAEACQLAHDFHRDTIFQRYLSSGSAILDAEAWPVQGSLGIQLIIDQAHDYLQMSLGLHETAHHAKAGQQFIRLARAGCRAGKHGRNDRMIRAFPWGQGIGVIWLERKVVPPILQAETPSRGDNARTKPHIVAVDKGASIAFPVNNR